MRTQRPRAPNHSRGRRAAPPLDRVLEQDGGRATRETDEATSVGRYCQGNRTLRRGGSVGSHAAPRTSRRGKAPAQRTPAGPERTRVGTRRRPESARYQAVDSRARARERGGEAGARRRSPFAAGTRAPSHAHKRRRRAASRAPTCLSGSRLPRGTDRVAKTRSRSDSSRTSPRAPRRGGLPGSTSVPWRRRAGPAAPTRGFNEPLPPPMSLRHASGCVVGPSLLQPMPQMPHRASRTSGAGLFWSTDVQSRATVAAARRVPRQRGGVIKSVSCGRERQNRSTCGARRAAVEPSIREYYDTPRSRSRSAPGPRHRRRRLFPRRYPRLLRSRTRGPIW